MTKGKESTENVESGKQPFATSPPLATGVQEAVLIHKMNMRQDSDLKYKHHFDVDFTGDVTQYRDANSSLRLLLWGPLNNLSTVELMMPIREFAAIGTENEFNTESAAVFGRCVQRLATAVDPSCADEIHAWVNQNLANVLTTGKEAKLEGKSLSVQLGTTSSRGGARMISLSINMVK